MNASHPGASSPGPDVARLADFLPPAVAAARQRSDADAAEQALHREDALRWDVFHRLRAFSVNHAANAWNLRYSKRLAPYGLVFLFLQPPPRSGGEPTVSAATRIWKAGPESAHPLPLLTSLTRQTRELSPAQLWDPQDGIVNRCDDEWTSAATYLGVGFSSLDTATGTWAQVCQRARSEMEIPGTILYVATTSDDWLDQQAIVADRRGPLDGNTTTIHSYRALSAYQFSSPYPYADVDLTTLYHEFGHRQLLQQLWRLDGALHAAESAHRPPAAATVHDQRLITERSAGGRR